MTFWISQVVLKVRHIYQSGSYKEPESAAPYASIPLLTSFLPRQRNTLQNRAPGEYFCSAVSRPITEMHSFGILLLVEHRGLKAASNYTPSAETDWFIGT